MYQWLLSLLERRPQPIPRSEDVSLYYSTYFRRPNGGHHIIQANNSEVSQAISAGKLRETATSIVYDVTAEYVHFENVCMRLGNTSMHPRLSPFQARFSVYVNETTATSKKASLLVPFYVGFTQPRNNFWIFEFLNESVPRDWQIRNEIVVLPAHWMDVHHVHIFWYRGLPKLHEQLRKLESDFLSSTERNLRKTLIVPRIRKMPFGYRKIILDHGIASIKNFSDLSTGNKSTCFRHVVASGYNMSKPRRDVIDAIRNQAQITFNLSQVVCATYKVTLLNRLGTRRILNIDELATVIRQQRGFDVDVVSFEGMTIQQQLEIIRCTSLFIAVQGAGLAWMIFLPQNAMFIEIWFKGWAPRYKDRANEFRPDLRVKTVQCERVAPEAVLQKYAKLWFNHTGQVSSAMEAKLNAKSRRNDPIRGYVYKDSDCVCSNASILAALPNDNDFKLAKREN